MLTTLGALTPIFMIIVLGWLLYRSGTMSDAMWSGLEHACFYLLLPAMLVRTMATADFTQIEIGRLAAGITMATLIAALLLWLARPLLVSVFGLDDARYTSLFQGSTRWHGFIALAVVTALYGPPGVAIVAVVISLLVPLLNATNIMILVKYGKRDGEIVRPRLVRQILLNPFILATSFGVLLQMTGIGLPGPTLAAVDLLANGALGVSLLTIGAGLRPLRASGDTGALIFGVGFRLTVMPFLMALVLTLFGVTGLERTVGTICAAVPTAASSYVMARKMGGDAPLMANIITAQILAAALTLPIAIVLVEALG